MLICYMANISKLIVEKKGYTKLLAELSDNLSGSELNSLLLELFRTRSIKVEHEIIFERQEELGMTGVALAA